jgi:nicotinate dehydrogenase subunit B
MPLRHAHGDPARGEARSGVGVREDAMTLHLTRRDMLKGAGALVVTLSHPTGIGTALAAPGGSIKPPLSPDQLDTWLAIRQDGSVVAFYGKMDMGHGIEVAIAQIVAEELDVKVDRVEVVMGDTLYTVNQGGASGSTGIQKGGVPLRNAAAEARRVLLEMASERLKLPVDQLSVADGVVTGGGQRVAYGELIGGRYFDVPMEWNKQVGNDMLATGKAKPKPASQYKIVGQSIPRRDVAGKVFGTSEFVTDVKVPGMLHGRMIRPPVAGAVPAKIDEASIRDIPGVRIVWQKDFLGLVAEKEWDAIRAAEKLAVTWSEATPPFPPVEAIYDHIRSAPVVQRKIEVEADKVDEALKQGAKLVEAEYEWPFQSHASMGPACAIVDAKADGATLWTGSQKPHFARDGVARMLGLSIEKVRGIWIAGPGSYGRNDAGDAALDAAVLSQAVGRPVRIQGMRYEGHGWDPKGPASIHRARAALDTSGRVVAYEFMSRGFSRVEIPPNESNPAHSLAGQLLGMKLAPEQGFGVPAESYGFGAKRMGWEVIAPLLERASPLRTAHLRDPVGPQIHFASESFIDELALAAGADPVAFRLAHLKEARDKAVIEAAAAKSGWQPRPTPRRDVSDNVARGRGIAYAQRSGMVVAVIAEIEIDRRTGKVWPRKFTVGHDCGLIVNPDGLKRCIEGNIIQGTSRSLWEEVAFDRKNVTSVDWESYPILDITETPETIDMVLLDRPELPPAGAGEGSIRPVAAALANAIFDATGFRPRRAPLTPERVKAGLV